jgi:hypothetical protein
MLRCVGNSGSKVHLNFHELIGRIGIKGRYVNVFGRLGRSGLIMVFVFTAGNEQKKEED